MGSIFISPLTPKGLTALPMVISMFTPLKIPERAGDYMLPAAQAIARHAEGAVPKL